MSDSCRCRAQGRLLLPDVRSLAFAAQGWTWLLDLDSGVATRLTDGAGVDSRPRWSPDGRSIALVRDSGHDTVEVVRDVEGGGETVIDTETIELDPEFSADGAFLFYSSAGGDQLNLWRHHLASGADERLTGLPKVERNARRLPGGSGILYVHGSEPHRHLRVRDFAAGTDEVAHRETLTDHLTADVHPRERLVAYSAPIDGAYHIWTLDLDDPAVRHRLTDGDPYAITAPVTRTRCTRWWGRTSTSLRRCPGTAGNGHQSAPARHADRAVGQDGRSGPGGSLASPPPHRTPEDRGALRTLVLRAVQPDPR